MTNEEKKVWIKKPWTETQEQEFASYGQQKQQLEDEIKAREK